VVGEQQVDAHTLDITVASPAAGTNAQVRLLLPPGWSPSATQTWPVLYLLHGCCDTYQGWTQNTNVGQFMQGAPVIVALPDGGPAGLYTNWWNFGLGGQAWETFTATELPQILRSGFRASTRQAIGGVSTGGGAALILAAHYPGEYAAVASYSGADCTLMPSAVALVQATVIVAGKQPNALWGNPVLQRALWQQHDPCSLAASLRGTALFLSVGSGVTSSGSNTSCAGGGNILESVIAPLDYAFAAKLRSLGIGFTSDFYSGGCHSWPYWQAEFEKSWPMLAASLTG
jgi:S-formylglutathione hydrolase FrmB